MAKAMKTAVRKGEEVRIVEEEGLYQASSYLRIVPDSRILRKGNFHSYCRIAPEFDKKKVRKKPSFLKRIFYTVF